MAVFGIGPPPISDARDTRTWLDWFQRINQRLGESFLWVNIDFTGSTLSDIVDRRHSLLQNLGDDDHSQYLLLAGRAGGQTAFGGTAASEILRFTGTTDANQGFIDMGSSLRFDHDVSLNPALGTNKNIIEWTGTVPSSGSTVMTMMRAAPTITIDGPTFIYSAVRDIGTYDYTVTPGFAVNTLFLAQPQYETTTATIRPNQAFIFAAQAAMNNDGAGPIAAAVPNHLGMTFTPIMRTTTAGDTLTVTNHIGLQVSPVFSTAAGTTINFGTIRGLRMVNPSVILFGSALGTELMTAYIGVEVDAIPFGGNVTKRALRSALTAATATLMIENTGGADSDFGAGDIRFDDGAGIDFGTGQDVLQNWNGTALEWDFAVGDDLRLSANADPSHTLQSANFGTDSEFRFGFDRFAFGQTTSVGNQVGIFVAPARTAGLAGDWNDFLLTQAGNLDVNGLALGNVAAWGLNSISVTLSGGSISDITTLRINGMTTSGIGGADTSALFHTGRRRTQGVDNHAPLNPAQLTADVNDYAPATGNSMRQVWRLTSDASRTITGIAIQRDNDTQWIVNGGANDIVLAHQNAGSAAANRIITHTGANVTLNADESALLWYDDTDARWRILWTTGA